MITIITTVQSMSTEIYNENPIHLDRNLFERFYGKNFSSINDLDLSKQMIHTIDSDVFNETINLKTLKLSYNRLEIIKRSWFGKSMINLERLILRKNQITKIELLAFDNLKSLRVLDLRYNNLGNLDDGAFWGLNSLKYLVLDYNHITNIRYGWTYGLDSLEKLSIKFNQINMIDVDAFKPLSKRLWLLNLCSNRLQTITATTLAHLNQLQWLDLSNNSINEIDSNGFRSLKNLESLELSENELSNIFNEDGELFIEMKSLKNLFLNSNHIEKISVNTLNQLESLMILNLSSNPIVTIEDESFDWLINIQNIFATNLNLTCDCHIKWLYSWLKLLPPWIRDPFANQLQCSRPDNLRLASQISFMDIDPNLLCFDTEYNVYEDVDNDFEDQVPLNDNMPPYFVTEPVNITGKLGQSIRIDCPASGIPEPNISLSPYDKRLKFMAALERRVKIETIDNDDNDNDNQQMFFVIKPLTIDDIGYYNCNAFNEFGEIHSKFYLSVINDDDDYEQQQQQNKSTKINEKWLKYAPFDHPVFVIIIFIIIIDCLFLLIIKIFKSIRKSMKNLVKHHHHLNNNNDDDNINIDSIFDLSTQSININNDDDDDGENQSFKLNFPDIIIDKSINNHQNIHSIINMETFKI